MDDRAKHKVFTRALRGLRPGEAVEIPKGTVRNLPASFEETTLGAPPWLAVEGGQRQFRGPYNRHVIETRRSFVAHRDTADPRNDPIGHLAADVPELAAGLLLGAAAGYVSARSSYERSVTQGVDRTAATINAVLDGLVPAGLGLAAGLVSVMFLKWLFGE